MRMLRVAVAAAVVSAAMAMSGPPASACSYAAPSPGQPPPPPVDYMARAELVFYGEAVGTELVDRPEDRPADAGVPGNPNVYWTFAVSRVYKGVAAPRERIVLLGDPCGTFDFRLQHAYVVHACSVPDRGSSGGPAPAPFICAGTYEPDGDTQRLPVAPSRPPETRAATRLYSTPPAAASAVMTLAALVALLAAAGLTGFAVGRRSARGHASTE